MSESVENRIKEAALVHLVRLLAAELVAGKHRDDVDEVIRAIDRKIDQTPLSRGIDANDARAGFLAARKALAPVCDALRAQAAEARFSDQVKKQPSAVKHMQ
jgi:hypothetical protein